MRAAGEDAHVDAEFSDQHLGGDAGDAGDRLEQLALPGDRGDHLLDASREGGDRARALSSELLRVLRIRPTKRSAPGRNRTSARGLGNRCSIH
jgi:hypothetical protein